MVLPDNIVIGIVAACGALSWNMWHFLKAVEAAKKTKEQEKWDPLRTIIAVLPTLVAGFLAGYKMDPIGWEYLGVLMGGWAAADVSNEFGANNMIERYFKKVE